MVASKRRWILVSIVLCAMLMLSAVGYHNHWFKQLWFDARANHYQETWQGSAVWLSDYHVVIDARPVQGVGGDLSALTYDPERNTLFTVTNKDPHLLELSLEGELLRRIKLVGFADPEAVEYIGPGQFVIADERVQRLVGVRINEHTQMIDAALCEQLAIGVGRNGNKGFEGLAYDTLSHRLFVAKERDPMHIFEVRGFPSVDGKVSHVEIVEDGKKAKKLFVQDLSSLTFNASTGHVLALSDQSKMVLELNQQGKPISRLSLLAGNHGLTQSVPQAEGLAQDGQGNVYVVSEPNLFYKFSKR